MKFAIQSKDNSFFSKNRPLTIVSTIIVFIILECLLPFALLSIDNKEMSILSQYSLKSVFFIGTATICIGILKVILYEDFFLKNKKKNNKKYSLFVISPLESIAGALLVFVSVMFVQIFWGIDNEIDFSDVFLRVGLSFFPFLRISSFICLICIITRNIYITLFTTFFDFIIFGTLFTPNVENAFVSGFNNLMFLFSFDKQTIYSISPENGIIYHSYFQTFNSSLAIKNTILISLLFSLFYFSISYVIVKNEKSSIGKKYIFLIIPACIVNVSLLIVYNDKYVLFILSGAIIITLGIMLSSIKKRIIVLLVGVPLFLIAYILCLVDFFNPVEDYVKEFELVYNTIKTRYILSESKQIDWDYLYNKYLPQFVKATNNKDGALKYKLFKQFGQEFYDGHINYLFSKSYDVDMNKAECLIFGNDYGFSLLRLDSGKYVAINVEGCNNSYSVLDSKQYYSVSEEFKPDDLEERLNIFYNSGIHNGTEITLWDGMTLDELCKMPDVFMHTFSNAENMNYYLPVYAAGYGDDTVDISFVSDAGTEKTISLKRISTYTPRLYDSLNKLNAGDDIGNLEWKDIDKDTTLFRVNSMIYGSDKVGCKEYNAMKEIMREEIINHLNSGKKNLIIDLRSNTGGSPLMSIELASLFAPEGKNLYGYTSKINKKNGMYEIGVDGKYIKDDEIYCYGEDLLHNCSIVLLVNDRTISAGDHFTYFMSGFPNVTVMGLTCSNSSAQGCADLVMPSGQFVYSAVPILDINGDILIDTDFNHVNNVPVDIIIPTTEDFVTEVFDNSQDYVLDFALKYLEK